MTDADSFRIGKLSVSGRTLTSSAFITFVSIWCGLQQHLDMGADAAARQSDRHGSESRLARPPLSGRNLSTMSVIRNLILISSFMKLSIQVDNTTIASGDSDSARRSRVLVCPSLTESTPQPGPTHRAAPGTLAVRLPGPADSTVTEALRRAMPACQ